MQKKIYFLFFNIKKDYLNLIWSQNFASVISPAYHSRPNSQEKAKTHAHALVQNRGRGKQGALWAILLSPGGGGSLLLSGDLLHGSPNSDPISDQEMSISTPVFRRGGGHKTKHYMFT